MKIIASIGLFLLIATGSPARASGESFRTDINPALLYGQAFLTTPDLPQPDRDYLFNKEWRGQRLPEKFGDLVSRYDNQFNLVRRAAHATVPCDWGIDMSPGPATLLPHLARNKAIAQTARLRVMWHLQNGRSAEARDDLLAAFALGRNSSRDGTLIAALVQVAVESILCSTVAENFYQFSPETLKELSDGFAAAPPRGTMAACIPMEKAFFLEWYARRIVELQKANPGNDAKVLAQARDVLASMEGSEDGPSSPPPTDRWAQVMKAAGGKSDGVIKLLRDLEPLYKKLAEIMTLPLPEYDAQAKQFSAEIQHSPNPFVSLLFPALEKVRPKEFGALAQLAMVRAAAEYKRNGDAGLRSVPDPYGHGPFAFERFVFEGVDRGFKLKSAYDGRGFPEVLIFVEKEGPPFQVIGKNAGKELPNPALKR